MHAGENRELGAIGSAIRRNPYEPGNYLTRAERYEVLGFPDLGAGDAYKALLLSDEIRDDCGEYHYRVLVALEESMLRCDDTSGHWTRTIVSDFEELQNNGFAQINGSAGGPVEGDEEEEDVAITPAQAFIADRVALQSFQALSRTLQKCGCHKSAYEFAIRGRKAFPEERCFSDTQNRILDASQASQRQQTQNGACQPAIKKPIELLEQGSVRRELYAWNEHEPNRFAEASLAELNGRLREVAPKSEVRAVTLPLLHEESSRTDVSMIDKLTKEPPQISPEPSCPTTLQLGLFATEDIAPHETVLHERSILAANNRLYDVLCDACSAPLTPISPDAPSLPSCPDCEDTIFCSPTCHSLALNLYHPAVCNKPDFDILAKDPSPQASASALYLALLARALAMSQTQNLHPLDLPETKYLCGDFMPPDESYAHSHTDSAFTTSRHLPFTFHDNILAPLHILEKMDIDVFSNGEICDTWVINTLYAKFRGTASARFSTDERARMKGPEVCAVHPMWCLANHSCAPNVKWEWGGEIRFVARGGGDVVRWGVGQEEGVEGRWDGGIRKGEEILNHYCDVDLGVAERREWAVGSLGGMCMCERCVWEDRKRNEGHCK